VVWRSKVCSIPCARGDFWGPSEDELQHTRIIEFTSQLADRENSAMGAGNPHDDQSDRSEDDENLEQGELLEALENCALSDEYRAQDTLLGLDGIGTGLRSAKHNSPQKRSRETAFQSER
jgi:hypothetical protein